jgi:hypothetical protein
VYACAVAAAGAAYCWGGDGSGLTRGRPTRVAGGLKFRLIRPGQRHTCALTPAGKAYCWGLNDLGKAGDGTSLNERHSPVAVVNGINFAALAFGSAFTCGVRKDGTAWSCAGGSTPTGSGTAATPSRARRSQ